MTGVTIGAGTVSPFTPSGTTESTPGFNRARVARSFVFCVMFCRSLFALFVLFILAIMLSVLPRFTDSDYLFGIYKLFFIYLC